MKNQRMMRKVSSIMLAFLLSLILCAIFVMTGCLSGIFRNQSLLNAIDDSKYHEKSYDAFMVQAETLVKEAGLSKAVLKEVLPLRKFYIDEKQCMEEQLNDTKPSVTEEKIKEEVEEGILSYYTEKGITVTSEQNTVILETSAVLAKEYTNWITLDFLNGISGYWQQLKAPIMVAILIGAVLSAAIVFALCRMYRYKHRALRYVASGVSGAALLTLVSGSMLAKAADYADIGSEPVYYQEFLHIYFTDGIQMIKQQSILLGVLFIVVVGIAYAMRKRVTGE